MNLDIPEYKISELSARKSNYCVCIFVLNEGERIRQQLTKMREFADQADIIIADGGSTDGALPLDYLSKQLVRVLLTKQGPGALGAQMRMAFSYAMSEGYQGVIAIDGNNKDDPAAIPHFISSLKNGKKFIQGSRFIKGGFEENTPLLRYLGIRFIHAPLISIAAGKHYTDTTNGFRAYSRELLLDPRIDLFRSVFNGYELHYYLAIRAARCGMQIEEVPVSRRYPKGEVPSKIKGLKGYLKVLKSLYRCCTFKYDPKL